MEILLDSLYSQESNSSKQPKKVLIVGPHFDKLKTYLQPIIIEEEADNFVLVGGHTLLKYKDKIQKPKDFSPLMLEEISDIEPIFQLIKEDLDDRNRRKKIKSIKDCGRNDR